MRWRWLIATQALCGLLLVAPVRAQLAAPPSVALADPAPTGSAGPRRLARPGLGAELSAPATHAPAAASLAESTADPADAAPPGPDWTLDLSAQTSLPLAVGLEVQLVSPIGLGLVVSGGHTPSAYLGAVFGALGDAGVYRERLRPVVDEAIQNGAWNLRIGATYTIPEGLELGFGYTFLGAQSTLSAASLEGAMNRCFPWPPDMGDVPLTVSLHALHGRVGWRFLIEERLVVRVALGWTHTVATEAHLDVPDEIRDSPDDPATSVEQGIAAGAGEYGFSPELLLSAGYRF